MKKTISVLLVLVILFAFSSCSTGTDTASEATPAAATPTAAATASSDLPPYVQSLNADGFDAGACIEPTVIYDNAELATITATEIVYNEDCAALRLEITNHLKGYLQYDLNGLCANGLMLNFFDFDLIESGATVTKEAEFRYRELIPSGITVLAELTLCSLRLSNEDSEETELGPITLRTNACGIADAAGSVYEAMLSEDNQKQFSYSVLTCSKERTDIAEGVYSAATFLVSNEYEQTDFVTELHNDTNEKITVSASRPVVNGMLFPEDSRFLVDLMPHSCCVFAAGLGGYGVPDYCFEAFGLSPVSKVSFEYAIEPDGREATDYVTLALSLPDAEKASVSEGKLVYDKDGISIKSFGLVPESEEDDYIGSTSVLFTIENRTDKEYDLQDDGVGSLILNDKEIEFGSKCCTLPAGAVVAVSYETSFTLGDDLGITSVSEITSGTMSFHLYYCSMTLEEIVINVPIF